MRVLVTGGTGFIGSRFITHLRESTEHEIFGLARSDSSARRLEGVGVRPVRGDLGSKDDLRAVVEAHPPDVVVHLAAETALQRHAEKIHSTNTDGTRNLFEAVRMHAPHLHRFLFASTVVVGDAKGRILTEEEPLPVATAYGQAKKSSEDMLLRARAEEGFPAVIIRPSHVYGAGGWFRDAANDIRRHRFLIPGKGVNLWDVIHVDDVARALVALVTASEPRSIYHAVDDTPVTMKEFFNETARLMGMGELRHIPVLLAQLIRGREPIAAGVRSARSSNARLKTLGWSPRYPNYRTGLESTLDELSNLEGRLLPTEQEQ